MENNVTISVSDFCEAMRRSLEREADLLADRKELELQAKASGINVSAAKKWLKAEVQDSASESPKRVAKLIEQTVDQVVYGESLGHDLGILQNNQHREDRKVENNSNPSASIPNPEATGGEAEGTLPSTASPNHSTRSEVSPPPASDATGGTVIPVSPTHSTQDARFPAKSCAEGGASYALASPVIQTGASHGDDDLEIPAHMVRANWVDGSPPR